MTNSFLQNRYPTNGRNISCSNVALVQQTEDVLNRRINKINQSLSSKTILGTIGSVDVPYKGHETIIKSLSVLQKFGYYNYEYQLVGKGDISRLKKIAEKYNVADKVKFCGTMSHNEIFQWLEQIDIYAQPSRTEGLPRGLIEAMSCGVPSIGSNVGGIPELLSQETIFKNTHIKEKEVACLLIKLRDSSKLTKLAVDNFNKSKQYNKLMLDTRRNNFIKEFKEYGQTL